MRADAAGGLVEDDEKAIGELQRRAIQLNSGCGGLAARILLHHTGDGYPSVGDELPDIAARAVAEAGKNLVKPYGVRELGGKRFVVFQVWDFEGEYYDFTLYIVEEDLSSKEVRTEAMRSRYYAIGITKLLLMMKEAGFQDVARIDQGLYQPVLVGTKAL